MKKGTLLFVLLFATQVCFAQQTRDTISHTIKKDSALYIHKVNSAPEPEYDLDSDTSLPQPIKRKPQFLLFFNASLSIPLGDYGVPVDGNLSPYTGTWNVYGYALIGGHFNFSGVYVPGRNIGLAIQVGTDINNVNNQGRPFKESQNLIGQYLTGLYIFTKSQQSKCNFYFIILAGAVTASITNNDNSFFANGGSGIGNVSGLVTPGNGSGIGLCGGFGITYRCTNHLKFVISSTYLFSPLYFPQSRYMALQIVNGGIGVCYNFK